MKAWELEGGRRREEEEEHNRSRFWNWFWNWRWFNYRLLTALREKTNNYILNLIIRPCRGKPPALTSAELP